MRVLSRLAGWMLGAALLLGCTGAGEVTGPVTGLPAVGRPPGASQGPRVAVVVALRGDVKVESGQPGEGTTFAAVPELQLLQDDRLVVGPDGFVVVALHNGHVVRLNAGTSLRVDAMAPFYDPPASVSVEEGFARLLSPSERDDVQLRGAITRVAGWNTRMSAAETIAPQPVQPPKSPELDVLEEESQPIVDAPAHAPADAAPPVEAQAADVPLGAAGGSAKGRDDAGAQQNAKSRPRTPTAPAGPMQPEAGDEAKPQTDKASTTDAKKPAPPTGLDLPKVVVHQRDLDGKRTRVSLPGPFMPVRAELATCAGAGAKIRGRIAGKKLVELQIDGRTPKCVPGLIGKAVALEDGWIEMTVTP